MKILIIEDEAAASRRLAKLVREVDNSFEIVESLDSVESVLNWMERNPSPDLFLMDIHLADGSCFEIFNHIELKKPVVFTTAYDQYAIDVFKVNAIDYLLKPIKKKALQQALAKYKNLHSAQRFDYQQVAQNAHPDPGNKRFLIRIGQQIKIVEMSEVAYFYTQDKITFLITKKGKRYPVDYTLEKLDNMVDQHSFFRINRQFIISLDAIAEMHTYSKSRVKIILAPPINIETIVSTERSPTFKKWLAGDV